MPCDRRADWPPRGSGTPRKGRVESGRSVLDDEGVHAMAPPVGTEARGQTRDELAAQASSDRVVVSVSSGRAFQERLG